MDISDSLPPRMLVEGIRTMALASRFGEMPVPFHTMISNVPGPPYALHLQGARLKMPPVHNSRQHPQQHGIAIPAGLTRLHTP